MLTQRQSNILKMVVEVYVKTVEPVGSKILSQLFEYSSATIRNEMALLEQAGYLMKTHTSSGRIPSEEGYRKYVQLTLQDKSSVNDFPLLDEIFERNAFDREEAVKESMSLVSSLTNYAVVALGASAHDAKIQKIQLVCLNDSLAVIILITDEGYVESKKIYIPDTINSGEVIKVINYLNDILKGSYICDIDKKLKEAMKENNLSERIAYYDELIGVFARAIVGMVNDKYFVTGKNNMLNQPEFQSVEKIKDLMKALDEKEIVRIVKANHKDICIRIGRDINVNAMEDCTIISVPYVDKDGIKGALAVIGPKRMQYKKVIPMLEYIAKNMNKL